MSKHTPESVQKDNEAILLIRVERMGQQSLSPGEYEDFLRSLAILSDRRALPFKVHTREQAHTSAPAMDKGFPPAANVEWEEGIEIEAKGEQPPAEEQGT